jgi:Golgi nucleoside diphosphatase
MNVLGLSSYAEDPKSAANSISRLLQSAKEHIPQDEWSKTPITLKATAGKFLITRSREPLLKGKAQYS